MVTQLMDYFTNISVKYISRITNTEVDVLANERSGALLYKEIEAKHITIQVSTLPSIGKRGL